MTNVTPFGEDRVDSTDFDAGRRPGAIRDEDGAHLTQTDYNAGRTSQAEPLSEEDIITEKVMIDEALKQQQPSFASFLSKAGGVFIFGGLLFGLVSSAAVYVDAIPEGFLSGWFNFISNMDDFSFLGIREVTAALSFGILAYEAKRNGFKFGGRIEDPAKVNKKGEEGLGGDHSKNFVRTLFLWAAGALVISTAVSYIPIGLEAVQGAVETDLSALEAQRQEAIGNLTDTGTQINTDGDSNGDNIALDAYQSSVDAQNGAIDRIDAQIEAAQAERDSVSLLDMNHAASYFLTSIVLSLGFGAVMSGGPNASKRARLKARKAYLDHLQGGSAANDDRRREDEPEPAVA